MVAQNAQQRAQTTDASYRERLLHALRHRPGFFCDFDGTISQQDTIISIMRHFVPEPAEPIIQAVRGLERTVEDGVRAMFDLIETSRFPEVERYSAGITTIREGFERLVALCGQQGWPFAVVSGGFDFFVDPALHDVREQVEVYCNSVRLNGPRLEVVWNHPCDPDCTGGCGLCKPSIVRAAKRGTVESVIVIGDGVTDYKVAGMADFVFARDRLLEKCRQEGWPHAAYHDFDDIVEQLAMADSDGTD